MNNVIMPVASSELSNLLTVLSDPRASKKLAEQASDVKANREQLAQDRAKFDKEKQIHLDGLTREQDRLKSWASELDIGLHDNDFKEKALNKREADLSSKEISLANKATELAKKAEDQSQTYKTLSDKETLLNNKEAVLLKREQDTDALYKELNEKLDAAQRLFVRRP